MTKPNLGKFGVFGHHDLWQRTTLTVACVSRSAHEAEELADGAERWLASGDWVLVRCDDHRDEQPLLADLGRWWGEAVTLGAAIVPAPETVIAAPLCSVKLLAVTAPAGTFNVKALSIETDSA